jgi:hypothetical protein
MKRNGLGTVGMFDFLLIGEKIRADEGLHLSQVLLDLSCFPEWFRNGTDRKLVHLPVRPIPA